jgi:NAD-dependent DNA ligase
VYLCGIEPGKLFPGGYIPCSAERTGQREHHRETSCIQVVPDSLRSKTVVFTGTLARHTRDEA